MTTPSTLLEALGADVRAGLRAGPVVLDVALPHDQDEPPTVRVCVEAVSTLGEVRWRYVEAPSAYDVARGRDLTRELEDQVAVCDALRRAA